jgi:hypothetical protein
MPHQFSTQPTISGIVSRYSEDISWIEEMDFPITIYNKNEIPLHNSITLKNIGRESHTYLSHIVNNYPDFSDFTVFMQGSPFFHLEEGCGPKELRDLIHQNVTKNIPFKGLAWFRTKCDRFGRPHQMNDPQSKDKWLGWGKDIPVGETFKKLFQQEPPQQFIASAMTGNFIVRKDRILCRPLSFYLNALEIISNDPQDEFNTGHAFERLWQLIFNGNERLNPTP